MGIIDGFEVQPCRFLPHQSSFWRENDGATNIVTAVAIAAVLLRLLLVLLVFVATMVLLLVLLELVMLLCWLACMYTIVEMCMYGKVQCTVPWRPSSQVTPIGGGLAGSGVLPLEQYWCRTVWQGTYVFMIDSAAPYDSSGGGTSAVG